MDTNPNRELVLAAHENEALSFYFTTINRTNDGAISER